MRLFAATAVEFVVVCVTATVEPPVTLNVAPAAPPAIAWVMLAVTAPVGAVVAPPIVMLPPVPPVAVNATEVPPVIEIGFAPAEVAVAEIAPVAPVNVRAPTPDTV